MESFLSMMNGGALRFVPFTIFKIFAKRCFACYKFNVCCCAVSLYSDYTGAAVIFNDFLCFFKRNIQSALRIAISGGSAFCSRFARWAGPHKTQSENPAAGR